jgi:hypothetical protein
VGFLLVLLLLFSFVLGALVNVAAKYVDVLIPVVVLVVVAFGVVFYRSRRRIR